VSSGLRALNSTTTHQMADFAAAVVANALQKFLAEENVQRLLN
jgi:hypothetical protein